MDWLDMVARVALIVVLGCMWWQMRDLGKRIERIEETERKKDGK